jgi:hypothetical protein
MNALVWLNGAETRSSLRDEQGVPVLRRTEVQAEAGPLMLMVRRANMGLSIAAGGAKRKALFPLRFGALILIY